MEHKSIPKAASGTATRVQNRDRPPPLFSGYPLLTRSSLPSSGRTHQATRFQCERQAGESGPGKEATLRYTEKPPLNTAGSQQCQGH